MNSDADVPIRSVELESDEFACGAYSIAQAMTRAGLKSYLYYFTYVDPGKRARLGAHHGEELFFLSDSFPTDWEHTDEDQELGKLMRGYWVEFAKTGDPNLDNAPRWTPYDGKSKEYFELGKHVGVHRIPERVLALESIMNEVVTQYSRSQRTAGSASSSSLTLEASAMRVCDRPFLQKGCGAQWAADRNLSGMRVNQDLGRLPHKLQAASTSTFTAHGCDIKLSHCSWIKISG